MENDLCLKAKGPAFCTKKCLEVVLDLRKLMQLVWKNNIFSQDSDIILHNRFNIGIYKK